MTEADSDDALMLRYCDGDNGAFDLLYERHKGPLYRYVKRMVGDGHVAEELYQDIWMKLIHGRDAYRSRGQFRAWLYRIAHNRIMDYFRRHKPAVSLDDDRSPDQPDPPGNDNPEHLALNRQFADRLLVELEALPAAQREVFLLREEAGLSLQEIAGLTESTNEGTKSRLRYALARLRQRLQEFMT